MPNSNAVNRHAKKGKEEKGVSCNVKQCVAESRHAEAKYPCNAALWNLIPWVDQDYLPHAALCHHPSLRWQRIERE